MKLGDVLFAARLAAAAVILWFIDFDMLARILRSINPDLVALAVFLELAGFLVWTLKWKFLVDRLEKVNFTALFLGLMAGNCLNTNVLRARTLGGFGQAAFLKNTSKSGMHAYATVAADQTSNSFVFSLPVAFSLLFVFLFLDIPRWLSILLQAVALAIFLLALTAYLSRRTLKRAVMRLVYSGLRWLYDSSLSKYIRNSFGPYSRLEGLIEASLSEFANIYRSLLQDRRALARDLALSALMFAFIYSKAYVLFQGVGYDISILHLVVALTLTLWVISVLPIPGGIGFKELVMISIYAAVGVPVSTAVVVSFMDRAIYLFYVIVVSYLAVALLRVFRIGQSL